MFSKNKKILILLTLVFIWSFSPAGARSLDGFWQTPAPVKSKALSKYLVNIRTVDPTIVVDMRYARSDNFLKKKVYSKNEAYLRPGTAKKLALVQKDLRKRGLGLKVWDAYRPHSVQKMMWKIIPDERYVANPSKGSVHNRGCAVDVTLVDKNGRELEMPTPFDDFTSAAAHKYSGGTKKSRQNREILLKAMKKRGFLPIPTEWWHYNDSGAEKQPILDLPL